LLERQIEKEEIPQALRVGGRNEAPGSDGIGLEFYKANWTALKDDLCTVMNRMHMGKLSQRNKNTG